MGHAATYDHPAMVPNSVSVSNIIIHKLVVTFRPKGKH